MPALPLARAALAVLIVLLCTREAQTGSSLRVGDYDADGALPNGTSLPLYTLTWRAVGQPFADHNFVLNSSFTSEANTAFAEAPHKMLYTAVNIQDAAAFNTSRTLNGQIGDALCIITCS